MVIAPIQAYISLLEAKIAKAEGNLRAAESAFLEAREGFSDLDASIFVALTSLELALLYLELEEPDRALAVAVSSIPCLSQFACHKEAISALVILEEASKSKLLNKNIVAQALHHVELVRADPTSMFMAQ